MNKFPTTFSTALGFILLNAFIWLAFAIIVAAGAHPAIPAANLIRWGMAGLAFLAASALVILFFLLKKRSSAAFYLTAALLGIIAVLDLTDEFGLADLIVLISTLVPLALLISNRVWYLRRDPLA